MSATHPSDLRWKMIVACDICKRRKVRCDGERPCSRCARDGRDCTFESTRKTGRHRHQTPPHPSSLEIDSSGAVFPSTVALEPLLLVDSDDQLQCSGPSSGLPLLAAAGLLQTVQLVESEKGGVVFESHSSAALGLAGAVRDDGGVDVYERITAVCPPQTIFVIITHHLISPVFFPLLHSPSFLAEFVAVSQRRLPCSPQYGAMLASILAVTVRHVSDLDEEMRSARPAFLKLAQTFMDESDNKLDLRYILATYHLALESQQDASPRHAEYVARAVGLAMATGLQTGATRFRLDSVTHQIRNRLFWAIYMLDLHQAQANGRTTLIRASTCGVELPIMADNASITSAGIIDADSPPTIMVAAVKLVEIGMILEEVLTHANAAVNVRPTAIMPVVVSNEGEWQAHALRALDKIANTLPSALTTLSSDHLATFTIRVRLALSVARVLVLRQSPRGPDDPKCRSELVKLSIDAIKDVARLRHRDLLGHCEPATTTHLITLSHTLLLCMSKDDEVAFTYRPDLLCAIELLQILGKEYPAAQTAADMVAGLAQQTDKSRQRPSHAPREGLSIRVLASRVDHPEFDLDSLLSGSGISAVDWQMLSDLFPPE